MLSTKGNNMLFYTLCYLQKITICYFILYVIHRGIKCFIQAIHEEKGNKEPLSRLLD